MVPVFRAVALAAALFGSPISAQSSSINKNIDTVTFNLNGTEITISRSGASCPPSCIQPLQIAPGVTTLGELELISFLEETVGNGSGLLIDVRMPDVFAAGSIPGAVNVPVSTFQSTNPYRDDLLTALGVANVATSPDFANAFSLVLYGNGPDDNGAANAIGNLRDAGYPAGKVKFYRGGASNWTALGLNFSVEQ